MISLITPTGGRPEAFHLLEYHMSRSNFNGQFQWIVVDDFDPATPTTLGQNVIRAEPRWQPGKITMCRNILVALDAVRFDKVLFIEDDEAYLPDYLDTMYQALETCDLVGLIPARYYNVATRKFREIRNVKHASLCQTGIRRAMFPRVRELCKLGNPFLDLQLWTSRGNLIVRDDVVSIKGLPGRPGIGIGHKKSDGWAADPELKQLTKWLGNAKLANMYSRFHNAGNARP